MGLLIFVVASLLLYNVALGDGEFGYSGEEGPQNWGDSFKTCLGKYQSPIDIEDKDVWNSTFPPLEIFNVESPHPAYMTNNGHTVMILPTDPDPDSLPTISGGPLNDTYVFQQLHFHWGKSDDVGSEDLINNHSFSMELHAVFWKKLYGSQQEALKHEDGLTVLAYLYQAADKPNPTFEPIMPQIPEIKAVGSNSTISDVNILNKLIAPNTIPSQDYYTYKGSLTTPPCLEIVQWIDFIHPQIISHEQLAVFRSIKGSDGSKLTHNYRPVQPLDDRVIYRNIYDKSSGSPKPTETSKPTVLTTMEPTAQPTTAQSATAQSATAQPTTVQPTTVQPTTSKPTTAQTSSKPTTAQTTSKLTNAPTTSMPPGKVTMAIPTNEVTDASMPERSTMKPVDNESHKNSQGRVQSTAVLAILLGILFL
nr:carbonic anhydrase 13-like [Nomia melanderi]